MSDSHEAPADCPATLRPWRGAPGEDQVVDSKVHGKRGPLAKPGVLGRLRESPREPANAIGPQSPASARPLFLFTFTAPRRALVLTGVRHVRTHRCRRPAARPRPGCHRAARHRRRGRLRRARLRRQRARAPAGLGRRGRLRAVLRQCPPGRRVPLAVVDRPVRERPPDRRRVPRLPGRGPGGLHPVHHRLPEPARRRAARALPGLRLRDRAPRLAAALAGRRRDLPRRPAHARAGRRDPGAGPRRPRAVRARPGLRHRRLQRHRRAVAGAGTGRRRSRARRPDRAGRRPARPAPPGERARPGRRLGRLLRAQAVRALRLRRAGRAGRLAARGRAVPGRWRRQPQRLPARGRRRGRAVARQRRAARGRVAQRHRRLRDRLRLQGAHRGRGSTRWSPARST
ncbi:hypothetical protein RKD38_005686 [Streptomyces ambofaciens]